MRPDTHRLDFALPKGHPRASFNRLYSELALHQAVLKIYTKSLFSWRKSLVHSHDGKTLFDFARNGPQNIQRLHQKLSRREFHFGEGIELRYNFNGKLRTVYMFPWEERLVDLMLFQTLNKYFHSVLSSHSYAYRHRDFGVDFCQKRLSRAIRRVRNTATGQGSPCLYALKRDVTDYFGSIDHEVLLAGLRQWIDPKDYLFELIQQRVGFRFRRDEEVLEAHQGVAFGTPVACFLANVYLTPLDRRMEALDGVRFFRYADDLLAICGARDTALRAAKTLEQTLSELRLESKPSHHRDMVFCSPEQNQKTLPGSSFEKVDRMRHLGLEFRKDGSVGLPRDKFRKICNRFRFTFRRERQKLRAIDEPMQRAQTVIDLCKDVVEKRVRSVALIDYYLKHVTDEEQLKRLDRWMAEEVLAQVFDNGHKKGNFKLLSFKKMREMGLPSLRHRRRLLRHGHIKSDFFDFEIRGIKKKS